jgi:uncharacterized protein YwbE
MLAVKAGRRAFLGCLLWAYSLIVRRPDPASAQSAVVGPLGSSSEATLEAVVDAIIPRDQDPGALDAGVSARILAHLSTHPEALKLYRAGLELVDRLAHQAGASSFRVLGGPERERILSSLASAADGPRGAGGEFLARVRRDVLAFYWGSVVGQSVVGYRPPLSGYPEYADPPPQATSPRQ